MPLNVMDVHYRSFQKQVLPVLLQRGIGTARAHPEPDVGRDQAGGIVDSVADHRDRFAGLTPAMDPLQFFVRRETGMHFLDACFARHGRGRFRPVTGDERDRAAIFL